MANPRKKRRRGYLTPGQIGPIPEDQFLDRAHYDQIKSRSISPYRSDYDMTQSKYDPGAEEASKIYPDVTARSTAEETDRSTTLRVRPDDWRPQGYGSPTTAGMQKGGSVINGKSLRHNSKGKNPRKRG